MLNHSVKFDLIPYVNVFVMVDKRFVIDKPMTFNCGFDLVPGNLNFVSDTPSHFALPCCEV